MLFRTLPLLVASLLASMPVAAPSTPTGLRADVQGSSVSLTWNAPATGGTPIGYEMEAGTQPGLADVGAVATIGTALAFSGVPDGRYYVRVRTTNSGGISAPTADLMLHVGCAGAPAAPTALNTMVVGRVVGADWTVEPGTTSTILELGYAPSQTALTARYAAPTAGLSVTAPPATYYVRVRAVNACGQSAPSVERIVVVVDIAPHIRFSSREGAEARRRELSNFIWPAGRPGTRPRVTSVPVGGAEMRSVDANLIDRVERWDVEVDRMNFHSLTYVAFPRVPEDRPARLAIVFAGHMPEGAENFLALGLSRSIEALLREGYIVAAMQMPLTGWNQDRDGWLPDGGTFSVETRLTGGHDELLRAIEPALPGGSLRVFLEPVTQTINEMFARYPRRAGLLMVGLSGGGWTTQMAAAVDPRIDISIPVAGSLPLYARPFSPGSKGDGEQEYDPIYREEDTNGDGVPDTATGVSSWLEIYALGALAPAGQPTRHQVQVVNLFDACCFGGTIYQTYAEPLTTAVGYLGGDWQSYLDASHHDHVISDPVIANVLVPAAKWLAAAASHHSDPRAASSSPP